MMNLFGITLILLPTFWLVLKFHLTFVFTAPYWAYLYCQIFLPEDFQQLRMKEEKKIESTI